MADTTTQVQTIIDEVLLDCHAFKDGRTPSTTLRTRALGRMNAMLKSWGADPLAGIKVRENLSVSSGVSSYTIGTSMVWNTERPKKILSALLRDSANVDYPLKIHAREDWENVRVKTAGGVPTAIYYDEGWPTGICYFDCAPSGNFTLYLESLKPFAAYTNLTDPVNLPEEYQEAIHWNLLLRLAPIYGHEISQLEGSLAEDTLQKIKIGHAGPIPQARFEGGM